MSDRPLRVGYVAKMFPRLSETFVLNEILELERQGVQVEVFSAKSPNEGRFHPQLAQLAARVHYLEGLDPKKWTSWMGLDSGLRSDERRRLWSLVDTMLELGAPRRAEELLLGAWVGARARDLELDRLHAHFATLPATLAWAAHRVTGIPFSFTAHAKDIYVYEPSETLLRDKLRDAEFVVTVTDYNRRHILDLVPDADARKVRVLHNGIDLDSFTPSRRPRADCEILAVGRLVEKKGFHVLLEACARIRDAGVSFTCRVMGDGVEAERLAALRNELRLDDCVRLEGAVTSDVVREAMQSATVFCLPCTVARDNNVDALPTVLLEALASGLPAVSTTVSGVPEIIEHERSGLLVPPDDAEALADALVRMLDDAQLRQRCAQGGRARARERFDIRRNVATLKRHFESSGTITPAEDDVGAPDIGCAVDSQAGDGASFRGAPSRDAGLRMLYVCADPGVPFGGTKGASVHVGAFVTAATTAGWDVTVAVARRRTPGLGTGVRVLSLDEKPTPNLVVDSPARMEAERYRSNDRMMRVLERAGEPGVDVVYERYSLWSVAGLEYARRVGVPFVLEVNAPLVEEASEHRDLVHVDLARDVERTLLRGADHVVVVSEELAEHVRSIAPQTPVTVVPNGVDLARFEGADPVSARARLVGDFEGIVVGFVGRVRPWHGIEHLVEAVEGLDGGTPVRLAVVGRYDNAGPAVARAVARSARDARVEFVGEVPHDDVPAVLRAMDVLVASYPPLDRFYFSPLKVFEYMAAGRAIVASDIGQISKILAHDRNALLVPPGDVVALRHAIERVVEDGSLRRRLGDAARAAAGGHSWARRIETVGAIVQSVRGNVAIVEAP